MPLLLHIYINLAAACIGGLDQCRSDRSIYNTDCMLSSHAHVEALFRVCVCVLGHVVILQLLPAG